MKYVAMFVAVTAASVFPSAARDAAIGPAQDAPLIFEDFEANGVVQQGLLRNPRLTVAGSDGVAGGRALRTVYVGGPTGSEVISRVIPLGEAGTDYTLVYDVKFDRAFQFVRGGKMHGLGPTRAVTGGGALRPDGWSARVMWRENGRPVTYTYHQDQRDKYGDDGVTMRPFTFALDRYQAVSLHVRLNSAPDVADGFVRLYVDGALISAEETVRLRASEGDKGLIDSLLFSTFHGGSDATWAPRDAANNFTDVYAWFDNIAVYRGEHIRLSPGA